MTLDWQQVVVWLIGAAAVAYLLRVYAFPRKRGGCGGCDACPGASDPGAIAASRPPNLVQIELEPRAPRTTDQASNPTLRGRHG